MNRIPFAPDEWYHCYTRGVEKRKTFLSTKDYERFMELLYLSNATERLHRSDMAEKTHLAMFDCERGEELVDIGAYALMPNHFHLLLRERSDNGITTFMRKLGTGYTMYFNIKNKRTGNLFVKPFRSRHIDDDRYLGKVLSYIHINPLELVEPDWKSGIANTSKRGDKFLHEYPYSSMLDYDTKSRRVESRILSETSRDVFTEHLKPVTALIKEGREYYAEFPER